MEPNDCVPPVSPGPSDVICSRSRFACKHSGNQRYQCLIEESAHDYAKAKRKSNKTLLISSIVDEVLSAGGSFLMKSPKTGEWTAASKRVATEKTGQALRKASRSSRLKKERNECAKIEKSVELIETEHQKTSRSTPLTCTSGLSLFDAMLDDKETKSEKAKQDASDHDSLGDDFFHVNKLEHDDTCSDDKLWSLLKWSTTIPGEFEEDDDLFQTCFAGNPTNESRSCSG